MKSQHEHKVRQNTSGEPDVEFYIAEANKIRAALVAQWVGEAKCWLRQKLHMQCHSPAKIAYR